MILVFTPVHGRADVAAKTFASIEANVPEPFEHLVFDDASPEPDAEWYRQISGDVKKHAHRGLFTLGIPQYPPPNMGQALAIVWGANSYDGVEALLCVESDVILRPGIVEAFREAQALHGERCGAVAPLYAKVGENTMQTYGGCEDRDFLSIPRGAEIGSWDMSTPRIESLPWAHLACLWIPRSTLLREDIHPDPAFRLYYLDHDLSHQIRAAGLDIIVTDRAVAEHTRAAVSTGLLWPDEDERNAVAAEAFKQLRRKWHL